MNKDKIIGNSTMLTVSLLFAGNYVITKSILDEGFLNPYSIMLIRMLFGTIAFWTTSMFIKREKIDKKDWKWIFLAALLGIILNQGTLLVGLKFTSPIDASILATLAPIITMIVSYFYLKEPISKTKIPGVILGALGAISLIYFTHHGITGEGSNIIGNLIILLGVTAYACFFVFSRGISKKYSSITIMKWLFLICTISLLPFLFNDLATAPLWSNPFNMKHTALVLYILIGSTFLPYMLIPIAQKFITPTAMSMYNYVTPVVATSLGIWLGQGELTLATICCSLAIFIGVFLVTRSGN